MIVQRTLIIPQIWLLLRDLQQLVEEMLPNYCQDVRDATCMVAAELVSNAIKYGESVPAAQTASLTLTLANNEIRIAVRSGATSESAVAELQRRIHQIAAAESKEMLYMNRLQQMLDDQTLKGGLGLYRIGFEGKFDLSCTYADQVLVIIATRGIQ